MNKLLPKILLTFVVALAAAFAYDKIKAATQKATV
jgi:hypothetical protein